MENTDTPVRTLLQSQFAIAWSLLDYHLTDLDDTEALWVLNDKTGLQVHQRGSVWHADWPETEAYTIGPASIAWTTWHIIFWWSMAYDYSFGEGTLQREDVLWPGSIKEAIAAIHAIHDKWLEALQAMPDEELFTTKRAQWPFTDKPFYEVIAWLTVELTKNAAEIGSGRFLYAAQQQ